MGVMLVDWGFSKGNDGMPSKYNGEGVEKWEPSCTVGGNVN